jgi:hypothetical protein
MILVLSLVVFIAGCGVMQTIANFKKLQFKIDSANELTLGGIDISHVTKLEDFNATHIAALYKIIFDQKIPLSFTLNIAAKNPNEGSDGTTAADITLKSMPFTLYIDENEYLTANIKQPVVVPAQNEVTIIPIQVDLDLWEWVKGNNFNNTLKPILALGGVKGITTHLKLTTKPVIGTPIGDIEYPGTITIVDHKFN